MLYTLVGNGNANPIETIATLESLRSAVQEPDEFWMMFMDPHGEPSDTVKAIVGWLDDHAIYYEVVVTEGADVHPALKNADETHVARRSLDYLLKLTKHRIQPDEKAAILVLSDDLDNDQDVLFAVERGGADGFSVYDLGGQMTQIIIDDGASIDEVLDEVEAKAPEVKAELAGQTPPAEGKLSNSQLIQEQALADTQLHQQAVEAGIQEITDRHSEALEELANEKAPLSYTRADLETLTRDELKALVKTQKVTPTDMRSKASMIEALMAAITPLTDEGVPEGTVPADGRTVTVDDRGRYVEPEPDIEGRDITPEYTVEPTAVSEEFREAVLNLTDGIVRTYLLKVVSTGALILVEIPAAKLPVIETLLAEE